METKTINIQELIDKALEEKNASRDGTGSGKWKPSMLGRCYRAHYWARAGEEKTNPPDARALRIFAVGNLFHEWVQKFLPEKTVEVEVVNDDFYGFADHVGEDTVYDLKTQHSRAFWFMKKDGYDIKKEKFTNWLQVALYAKILGKKRICLVFISKDDLCIDQFTQELADWEEPLQKEIDKLNEFWNKKELPPAEPRAYNGKECQYCPYLDKCKPSKKDK